MPDTKGFNFTVNIQTIGVFIAALGSIAALISAWYQVAPGNPELQARITHIEEFSSKPEIDGLSGEFTYKGNRIEKLITLRMRITNIGNKTIIGKGSQKNIIDEKLTINSYDKTSIVNSVLLSNDFDVDIATDEDSLALSFNQWRPNESIEAFIYLNSDSSNPSTFLTVKNRDIIDGDFRIVDATSEREKANPLNDYLSAGYVRGLKAFGYLSLSVFFPVFIMLLIEPLKTRYQSSRWKNVNNKSFKVFVDEKLSFLPEEEREQIKSDPDLLEKMLWRQYDGKKYPTPFGDSPFEAVLITFLFGLLVLGIIPLFVALHYLY
ncbi:hypothetical protein BZG05_12310 [Salinivibrio kushneri]|uniref:hypothetical protein n=1 Tax=Salinivibrio kushneri TaxID=1908198 RepID=UPI0009899B29|nr:hypothetical protein [Salinivibrio kushneri]OOE32913.1 hypothetical protein BZG05_12310 [Salinivibrio kushneri]